MAQILVDLDKYDLFTETHKEYLRDGLQDFLSFIEDQKDVRETMKEGVLKSLRELEVKCSMAEGDQMTGNKVSILRMFSNKKVNYMSKYVKELLHLDNQVRADKKFMKKIFEDKHAYYIFVRDNFAWILEKSQYDFTKDEVMAIIGFLSKNAKNIV